MQEDIICLLDFNKLFLGQFFEFLSQVGDFVRMILLCSIPVGGTDFRKGCVRGHAQNFIGISRCLCVPVCFFFASVGVAAAGLAATVVCCSAAVRKKHANYFHDKSGQPPVSEIVGQEPHKKGVIQPSQHREHIRHEIKGADDINKHQRDDQDDPKRIHSYDLKVAMSRKGWIKRDRADTMDVHTTSAD